jgi:hypothetical protein
MSINITYKGDGNLNFPAGAGAGLGALKIIPDSVAQSPQNQNLIYLFDPVYYNGYKSLPAGETHRIPTPYLNKIFAKYPSIIPASNYVYSLGRILNKDDDLNNLQRKAIFNNFFFSYEKYSDNSDIGVGVRNYFHASRDYGTKERKRALLQLIDPAGGAGNIFNLFRENNSKTFSCFIKLKGPVQHIAKQSTGRIIREKKGIFLNTGQFAVGYRSPHYTRTGNINGYKFQFEPFSFVFSIQDEYRNHSFMTDFKYKFNETYHLLITVECGSEITTTFGMNTWYNTPTTVKVYINGEQQTTAYMAFNPLINGNGKELFPNKQKSRSKKLRLENSPIQPGFYKTSGTIYSPTSNSHIINCKMHNGGTKGGTIGWSNLYLGKSNIVGGGGQYNGGGSHQSNANIKRYLNNIDVGVIQVYNAALSQIDIKNIYDTFGPRYQ